MRSLVLALMLVLAGCSTTNYTVLGLKNVSETCEKNGYSTMVDLTSCQRRGMMPIIENNYPRWAQIFAKYFDEGMELSVMADRKEISTAEFGNRSRDLGERLERQVKSASAN